MEKQDDTTKTLGQAIDELIRALSSLDEKTRITAIKAACEHLKIRPMESLETKASPPTAGSVPSAGTTSLSIADVKTLREEKNPASANEMAAIVAYYLSELAPQNERKSEVELNDMIKYFKQAKFPLPRRPRFLLSNTKNAGYLDSVGEGRYRLNPVGYNLVVHNLPRSISGGVKREPTARRRSTKTKSKKRKTT